MNNLFEAMTRYRIGEFARLSGVSAKTLRFYDDIGLLRPAAVDPRTRYRLYHTGQLKDLAGILALKELGVSLAEIRKAISNRESTADVRRVLEDLQGRVERSIEAATNSLSWIESALEQLRARQSPVPVIVKRQVPIWIASVRAEVNHYAEIAPIEEGLIQALPAEAIGFTRGTLWHRCAEAGLPEGEPFVELKRALPTPGPYNVVQLPPATAACAYSALDDDAAERAYLALHGWLRARGYRLAGAMREIYLEGMLEIQFPLA
ncbi:MAG TPA: MerR family transcriptional regulator [Terriglobales bacterium]|nr:MerR family transcriptional regulator [Terriglobales bacterium]